MTDEQLEQLNRARDEMLSWQDACERIARLKAPSFVGYGDGVDEPPEFRPPAHIFGSYKDKLTQWAQEGFEAAKAKYAAL